MLPALLLLLKFIFNVIMFRLFVFRHLDDYVLVCTCDAVITHPVYFPVVFLFVYIFECPRIPIYRVARLPFGLRSSPTAFASDFSLELVD